jgi:hypothetical protein
MEIRLSRLLWCAFVVFFFLSSLKAQNNASPIRVVESKMRLDFDPRVQFVLPLSNSSGKQLKGNVKIELLDRENIAVSSGSSEIALDPGNVLNNLSLGDNGLPTKSPSELATYRLRYSVAPVGESTFAPIEGIVQLGRIMTNPFQIRISAMKQVRPGTNYSVRVRVENPFDARPYSGTEVAAKLTFRLSVSGDEEPKPILRKAKSDADGYAVFNFDLPEGHQYNEGEVAVSVRRGVLLEQESIEFKYPDAPRLSLSTDKPIYQPGQTVHMRVQAFGPDNSALSSTDVELEISDPENLNAFRTKVKTSEFGIASTDWQVPSNLRLGDFAISASLESGDWYESGDTKQQIKISRYDLPNFAVEATPDFAYYTEGRNAKVKIVARYLFGEAVKQGHVRIARISSREWNYRSQKYDTNESDLAAGELDSDGVFTADVPLKDDFEDFLENKYEKYRDINFAAYVTDASTQRTEQRRFDLRITHQPIHMYISRVYPLLVGSPAEFYITSYYADGAPAPVDVAIAALKPNSNGTFDEDDEHPLEAMPFKAVVRTNAYGLVRVSALEIPKECLLVDYRTRGETAYLRLQAQDGKGAIGIEKDYVEFSNPETYVRLRTEKTLYREGNDVHVDIESNLKEDKVVVQIIGESESFPSRIVRLNGGRGNVRFPYDPRFHGELRIQVYGMSSFSNADGFARILFPKKQALSLGLHLQKASYKPGEQAVAGFKITTAQGSPVKGALGAVVFDKAVSERVRTDQDFGGRGFGFMDYNWYYGDSQTIAGISLKDLVTWDGSRPFPDGLDLLAEVLVNDNNNFVYRRYQNREDSLEISGGDNYFQNPSGYFQKIIAKSLEHVTEVLDSSYKKTGKYPYSLAELRNTLKENGIDFDALRDPWDMPYQAVFSAAGNQDVLELKSGGPDKQPDTPDDFAVLAIRRQNFLFSVLNASYLKTDDYPHNLAELKTALQENGIDFDALRDPWGTPYEATFSLNREYDVLQIQSAGPDRQRNTKDDLFVATVSRPYYGRVGLAIDRVKQSYFTQTGKYIRDFETLRSELLKEKIDLDALRDPWGNKYRYDFLIASNFFVIQVMSPGPDHFFSTENNPSYDDLYIWNSRIQYFQRESAEFDAALAEYFLKTGAFPKTNEQLQPVIAATKLSAENLKDPWGRPYYFTFDEESYYANSVRIKTYSVYPDRPRRMTTAVPVTQLVGYVHVMSEGPDGDRKFPFSVADFSGLLTEQTSKDLGPVPAADKPSLSSGTGGIKGRVTDPSGAVVVGATVRAKGEDGKPSYETTTGTDGTYILRNMQAGLYELHFIMAAFSESVVARVPVRSAEVTSLDVMLTLAESKQVIQVTASPPFVETSTSSVGCQTCETVEVSASTAPRTSLSSKLGQQVPSFTPRVRQYFPETLLWSPETITDAQGHVQLRFKLADNITTWTMSVVASTQDGHTGIVQRDISAFQPFFVEHEPPKVLTQGDVVALPVVLRNYLKEPQVMSVEMKPEKWFSLLTSPVQKITIPAGGSANATFNLRVDNTTKDGKQRVIASSGERGDAIERVIAIHPDGEEISKTSSDLLGSNRSTTEFDISEHAIRGSTEATLKLYPNLMAHIVESVRAITGRPDGCAEQTASVTLANLRALQILQKVGQDNPDSPGNPNAETARHARQYVQAGYEKLLPYREVDGGFSYWGKGDSNLAVTAHVLRVLVDAKSFTNVDEKVITDARDFIVKQQQADGSWLSSRWPDYKPKPDATLTAYLARVLATATASINQQKQLDPSVEKALHFLEDRIDEWKESYLVANYALAAVATNRQDFQEKARQQLLSIAHDEGSTTYWNVELNPTPFYGWGYTGRLETTALAVEALSLLPASSDVDGQSAQQMRRGLLFLLQRKDSYGVWYSTAATINVIDAIVSAMPPGRIPGVPTKATILLNGTQTASVRIPSPSEVTGPVLVDLPRFIQNGSNKIEIQRPEDNSPLMAQVVSLEYDPWEFSAGTKGSNLKLGDTRALRLGVSYDHANARVGDAIHCTVKAERIGFQGYGMLLAEIGLPPGVDVDRASLEAAMENSGYGVMHYDILPDRVILYLWPKAGGTEFNFIFRPRFKMEASNTPSLLYDYYNPDARSVVTPVKFVIN